MLLFMSWFATRTGLGDLCDQGPSQDLGDFSLAFWGRKSARPFENNFAFSQGCIWGVDLVFETMRKDGSVFWKGHAITCLQDVQMSLWHKWGARHIPSGGPALVAGRTEPGIESCSQSWLMKWAHLMLIEPEGSQKWLYLSSPAMGSCKLPRTMSKLPISVCQKSSPLAVDDICWWKHCPFVTNIYLLPHK